MSNSATISTELKELDSSLPPSAVLAGYTVPDDYFEGLAATIVGRIRAIEADDPTTEMLHLSGALANLSRENVYSVPTSYFSSLDPSFVFADSSDARTELEQLSPLLSGLSKKTPFNLPDGYLDQPVITPAGSETPVVKMSSQKWYRFAVAVSIAGIIGLAAFFWKKQHTAEPAVNSQSFAWMEKNMKKVSTEDISRFVDLASATQDVATVGSPDDIKGLLKNVSDKQIQDFLKDIPVDETDDDDILFN